MQKNAWRCCKRGYSIEKKKLFWTFLTLQGVRTGFLYSLLGTIEYGGLRKVKLVMALFGIGFC